MERSGGQCFIHKPLVVCIAHPQDLTSSALRCAKIVTPIPNSRMLFVSFFPVEIKLMHLLFDVTDRLTETNQAIFRLCSVHWTLSSFRRTTLTQLLISKASSELRKFLKFAIRVSHNCCLVTTKMSTDTQSSKNSARHPHPKHSFPF